LRSLRTGAFVTRVNAPWAPQTAFVVDFLIMVSTGYTTGPSDVRAFLPYTAVLRPVFLVYRSTKLRIAVTNFIKSVFLSRKVLGLGASFLAVSTVTSIALLEGNIEDTTVIGPTFGYVESFFVDMFVFSATAENYPDVVYVSATPSPMLLRLFSRPRLIVGRALQIRSQNAE